MNIEELSSQLESCKEQIVNLQDKVQEQERIIREHQHTGRDDSFRMTDADIILKDGHAILSGPGGFVGDNGLIDMGVRRLHIACGPTGISEGTLGQETKNMQLTFEHQDYQGGLNFIYGFSNAVSNTCSITVSSSQTTLTDPATDFGADNSRVGQYLLVAREQTTQTHPIYYGYQVTSSTKHSLTLSSAFGFDGKIVSYFVYKPIYFGSSIAQFQKIYTLDGLRFGPGQSYNGQNGLLYMDADGSLKYQEPDGDVTTVGGNTNPTGTIFAWSTDTAPDGYLLCDGSAVSRTTYSNLFDVIGTTYGSGDGSTTFNVPDLRGRVAVGKSTDSEFNALGKTGGEKAHQLTIAELASHAHYQGRYGGGSSTAPSVNTANDLTTNWNPDTVGQSVGSDTAHNNLQPYITLNYIIKT